MKLDSPLDPNTSIAIIGLALRFPGAHTADEFWHNLSQGIESITTFRDQDLAAAGISPKLLHDPQYIKSGFVIEDEDLFDAGFFGMNAKDAEILDPQQRLFLECAWEALENAGYATEKAGQTVGVYAGTFISTYLEQLLANEPLVKSAGSFLLRLGNDKDYLATRVSYKLNLKGPSLTVQTSCSTSLVAVHLACQSLLGNECDLALAGGVSISVPQRSGYLHQDGDILSPDGHCRAFDEKAQGTVFGNGVGLVVLKRLEDALADHDDIRAVIRGSAINNDGSLKAGYTAPSINGQARVIAEALAVAQVEADTLGYIETHGTGTPLGDPIEIAALTQVFRETTERKRFCPLGSVKANIGHLGAAAGIAGLIKTVLALQHQAIPPSLHFEKPNPKIDFANSPFYVNTTLTEWKAAGRPRRAGVSSFGFGGTNAHLILEEAPSLELSTESMPWHLLTLSAKSVSGLDHIAANFAKHFRQHPDLNLGDVTYSLQLGRTAFGYRQIYVCHDLAEATAMLQTSPARRNPSEIDVQKSESRQVAYMFPGQGTQYANATRELYQLQPFFREQVDQCCKLLYPYLALDLREVLYPKEAEISSAQELLNQTWITQPVLFVMEYALAQLWLNWGVQPQAMIGHSIGEYVAACLAGVFSLKDALRLVAERGRLTWQLPAGSMLSVSLPEQAVRELLGPSLSLAAVNAPASCVVSGPTTAVEKWAGQLTAQKVVHHFLRTSHAFHSSMLEPIRKPLVDLFKEVRLAPPQIPYLSNVTGTWITAAEATDPDYWVGHLCSPVRFHEGLQELIQNPNRVLLEVGPGHTLCSLAKQQPGWKSDQALIHSVRHSHDPRSDLATLLEAVGRLWQVGVTVDWSAFHRGNRRKRIPLPTYPFERQRYWAAVPRKISEPTPSVERADFPDWFYVPSWKRTVPPLFNVGPAKSWIVFSNGDVFSTQLIDQLQTRGDQVIQVLAGTAFIAHGENVYTIRPAHRTDYERLATSVSGQNTMLPDLIHLWNATARGSDTVDSALQKSFSSLLCLAQVIAPRHLAETWHVAVVSSDLHCITGQESLRPEKAALLGPCRVIPQELPRIVCQSIDVELPSDDLRQTVWLARQIIAEIEAQTTDAVIAYRGRARWVYAYEPAVLPRVTDPAVKLRQQGVYWITEGFERIGLALADYLARTFQARLILTTRSHFPAREEWDDWLINHSVQDDLSRQIRWIQAWEEAGSKVLVMEAAVADRRRWDDILHLACEQFGQIHGVILTPSTLHEELIRFETEPAAVGAVMRQVQSVQTLKALLQKVPLDFLVLCSSLTALVGGEGQLTKCAADAVLDAFAEASHNDSATRVVSINWPVWQEVEFEADSPSQVSGGVGSESPPVDRPNAILLPDGLEAFRRILGHDTVSRMAVCPKPLPQVIQELRSSSPLEPTVPPPQAVAQGSHHERPALSTAYVAARNAIEASLVTIYEQVLGVTGIGVYDGFFELGGHSLMVMQLVTRIRDTFALELPVQQVFESQHISGLAEIITQASLSHLTDEPGLAERLSNIENLSDEEVRNLLAEF